MLFLWAIIAAAVSVVDQLSKLYITGTFGITDHMTLIPGLIDIVYVENSGAAFSMLDGHTWLLGLVSAIFCVAITVYMLKQKPKQPIQIIAAGLLLGGALGNGFDRIFRGFVVDFIELTLFKFPVFNFADIAITVGAALIVIQVLIAEKKEQ